MYERGKLMFLYALTPIHMGSGSGVGVIDLPIQREGFTNFPILQSSGIKGSLREFFEKGKGLSQDHQDEEIFTIFGPGNENAAENAGALCVEEARLLLFPIRSLKGIFAYATCPQVLSRLCSDLEILSYLRTGASEGRQNEALPAWHTLADSPIPDDKVWIVNKGDSLILLPLNKIVFEEYAFGGEEKEELSELSNWLVSRLADVPLGLRNRLVLISDNNFRDFVESSTEVVTRNRIGPTGTVEEGALWNEEYLPRESVFYSLLLSCKPLKGGVKGLESADEILQYVTANSEQKMKLKYLWLGGNQTVGRGLVRVIFEDTESAK